MSEYELAQNDEKILIIAEALSLLKMPERDLEGVNEIINETGDDRNRSCRTIKLCWL